MPSLHAAYAVGVGIGLVLLGRGLGTRIAGLLYPPLVVLTIVVTGNHFIVDAIAGMLVMVIGLMASARLQGRKNRAILRPATRGGAVR